jgi:DNA-binding MarR family transcriptional regulator
VNRSLDASLVEVGATADGTTVEALADRVLDVVPRAMRGIRGQMRTRGRGELTIPQLRVLLYIRRHPGVGLSALAEHLGVSKGAASALVDRLVRNDLLDRVDDPEERRRIQLRLTPSGSERVGLAHLAVRTWVAEQLQAVEASELRHLGPALSVLEGLAIEPEART